MGDHDLSTSDVSSSESPPSPMSRFTCIDDEVDPEWPKTKLSDLFTPSVAKAECSMALLPPMTVMSDDVISVRSELVASESYGRIDRKRKDSPDLPALDSCKRPLIEGNTVSSQNELGRVMLSPERPTVSTNTVHLISDSEPGESDIECDGAPAPSTLPPKKVTLAQNKRKGPVRNRSTTIENSRIKLQEKETKAELMEKLRRLKPGNCIKYVTVILDSGIPTSRWGPALIESFTTAELKHRVESLPVNDCITWDLRAIDGETHERHVLLTWDADQIITSVKFNLLMDTFNALKRKFVGYKVYLAVLNLQDAYKKIKRNQNKHFREKCNQGNRPSRASPEAVTIDDVEMKLSELLILSGISSSSIDSKSFTHFIHKMTQTVSERPYKSQKEKKEQEYNYFARGDSKNCVRVDKDLNGLTQLWLQQLSQVTSSTLDIAKAIAAVYPSPVAITKAYDACTRISERELLLQDISIKRGWGPGATSRRLGPQMSRKMFVMFGTTDGSVTLNKG